MADTAAHIAYPILRLLAGGQRRSGQELACALGISRAAVWKQIKRLEALGLDVDARRGTGYRIDPPLDVLDRAAMLAALDEGTRERLHALEVLAEVESTNTRLFHGERPSLGLLGACVAEYQSGGRGRRGRSWLAPPGRGLCLSAAWVFPSQPDGIEALGLAAGVSARRVLAERSGLSIRVKWPNDLMVDDRKLGGILVELAAEAHGPCFVVVGIGINVSGVPRLQRLDNGLSAPPIDLAAAMGSAPPSRSVLAAALIDALMRLFEAYAAVGFDAYHAELAAADYLLGREIMVDLPAGPLHGRAAGIATDGRLRIDRGGEIRELIAGEVSVRRVE